MTAFFGILLTTTLMLSTIGYPIAMSSINQEEKSQFLKSQNESSNKNEEKNIENPRNSVNRGSALIPCSSFQQLPTYVGILLPVCDPKN